MTQEAWQDVFHTGPGTLAGRFLRTFWQPVARARDVKPGQAIPVRIMNEDFTLYRGATPSGDTPHPNPPPQGGRGPTAAPTSRGTGATPAPLEGEGGEGGESHAQASLGTAHLVAFRCAHRGTQLNVGWVEGDCIRCRYHGWMYDAAGQCVEQPGEDPAFAQRVRIRSYPTQEYMGLIFAYLGEGEPPPIKRFPDFENDPRLMVGPTQPWPCNYFNRVDNALDPLHVAFTHQEALTRVNRTNHLQWRTRGTAVTAEETEYGLCAVTTVDGEYGSTIHFHMPNVNQLGTEAPAEDGKEREGASPWGDRLFWRVPVDDTHCISYVVGIMNASGGEGSRRLVEPTGVDPNEMSEKVLAGKHSVEQMPPDYTQRDMFWVEDYVVQVGQGPIEDRSIEHLGKRDQGVFALRNVWERELRRLADGKPLKQWQSTGGLRSVW